MVDGEEGEIEIVDSPVGARVSTYSRTCIIVPASVKEKKIQPFGEKGKVPSPRVEGDSGLRQKIKY